MLSDVDIHRTPRADERACACTCGCTGQGEDAMYSCHDDGRTDGKNYGPAGCGCCCQGTSDGYGELRSDAFD